VLAFLCVVHVDGVDVDVVNVDGVDVDVDAPILMLMSCARLLSPWAYLEIWMSTARLSTPTCLSRHGFQVLAFYLHEPILRYGCHLLASYVDIWMSTAPPI